MCVCLNVCLMSPSHAIFFEASHSSSDHMTRSRPLPEIWVKTKTKKALKPLCGGGGGSDGGKEGLKKMLKSFLAAVILSALVKRGFGSRIQNFCYG